MSAGSRPTNTLEFPPYARHSPAPAAPPPAAAPPVPRPAAPPPPTLVPYDEAGGERAAGAAAVPAPAPTPRPERVLRFQASERAMHWAIAIPFMLCFATAVILVVVYNPAPRRPYRALFSWIHRLSGLALAILPLVLAHRQRRDWRVHLANVNEAWTWTLDDLRWLARMGLAAVSSRVQLPEAGKFNAAEKLNFMMVMTVTPLLAVSGLLIWMPGIAFFSWMLHFTLAGAAVPLMLGHVFMATINPGTRVGLSGMVSGDVDRAWAEHHYPRWYREHFPGPGASLPDTAPPAQQPTLRAVPVVPRRTPPPPG